jgi:pimeloyl-ACP methyl ester carboxylesterase
MVKRAVSWLVVGAVLASVALWTVHSRDMRRAYERIRGKSKVVPSPYGDIEYAEGGVGPPVLVIHGSGGGFDQGELLARAVLDERSHWIAPSRFGYLRSTFQPGATFDDQAHAYAFLLDHLGIGRAAVVTLSHGGPSALLFAVLHPDRVASLTLISAGVASSDDANQARANQQGSALTGIFQRDFRYWAVTTALRGWFFQLMGAPPAVIAGLTPEQRLLADQIVDFMNPVSPRAAGVAFDNRAAMPNQRIAAVRAPTLILHARDDTLQLYRNAEFAAATISGSRLVSFDHGGHLVLAVEQARIRVLVGEHLRASPRGGFQ